jgi:hypothetical protein
MNLKQCTAFLLALSMVAAVLLVASCASADGARKLGPGDVNLGNERDPKRL